MCQRAKFRFPAPRSVSVSYPTWFGASPHCDETWTTYPNTPILHSASRRLPRPFLPQSLNSTSVRTYNRLFNSSLASTPTSSADADSNVITQRLPPNKSQSTPIREYDMLVEAGKLRSDDYQTRIIQKLQALHDALALYDPSPSPGPPSLVRVSPFPFRHITSYQHSRL